MEQREEEQAQRTFATWRHGFHGFSARLGDLHDREDIPAGQRDPDMDDTSPADVVEEGRSSRHAAQTQRERYVDDHVKALDELMDHRTIVAAWVHMEWPGKTAAWLDKVDDHVADCTKIISLYSDIPEPHDSSQDDSAALDIANKMVDFLDCAKRHWSKICPKHITLREEDLPDDEEEDVVEPFVPEGVTQEALEAEIAIDDDHDIEDMFEEVPSGTP